jgi:hypothetical protein
MGKICERPNQDIKPPLIKPTAKTQKKNYKLKSRSRKQVNYMTVPVAGTEEVLIGALTSHVAILIAAPTQLPLRTPNCYMAAHNNFKQQQVSLSKPAMTNLVQIIVIRI